jgi:hypothetical protein
MLTINNILNLMLLRYVKKGLLNPELAYEVALFYRSIP